VIAGVLGRAGEAGQKKRLADAKNGKITWLPPPGLGKPKDLEKERKEKEGTTLRERVLAEESEDSAGKRRRGKVDPAEEEDDDF
jgi:small subunit ribosomal protein S2